MLVQSQAVAAIQALGARQRNTVHQIETRPYATEQRSTVSRGLTANLAAADAASDPNIVFVKELVQV